MKGVSFLGLHSFRDLHLLMTSKEIGSPEVKRQTIDIAGADGELDFTDYFGEPKYMNAQHQFEFESIQPRNEQLSQFTDIKNKLHGKKGRIILDDDPSFFYVGRCYVSGYKNDKCIGKIRVECDCEPYKYRMTSQAVNLCGKNLLNLDSAIISRPQYWTRTETGYLFDRGSVTGNGYAYFEIPVVKGRTYTFSTLGTTFTGNAPTLIVYKDFESREIIKRGNAPFSIQFVALETTRYAFTLIANSTTVTANFTNVMVREGDAQPEFEAFDATEKTVEATFSNLRKTAIPTVYVTGNMTIQNGTTIATLTNGANVLPEFAFKQGDNALTFVGNGVAVVEWKEGCL